MFEKLRFHHALGRVNDAVNQVEDRYKDAKREKLWAYREIVRQDPKGVKKFNAAIQEQLEILYRLLEVSNDSHFSNGPPELRQLLSKAHKLLGEVVEVLAEQRKCISQPVDAEMLRRSLRREDDLLWKAYRIGYDFKSPLLQAFRNTEGKEGDLIAALSMSIIILATVVIVRHDNLKEWESIRVIGETAIGSTLYYSLLRLEKALRV